MRPLPRDRFRFPLGLTMVLLSFAVPMHRGSGKACAQSPHVRTSLEDQLRVMPLQEIARHVELRGDPIRGAVVFHRSAAACGKCHLSESPDAQSPLGPDLTRLGQDATTEHLIESLLFPSKKIRQGYETVAVLRSDGQVVSGLKAREDDREVTMREASSLDRETVIPRDEIESMHDRGVSMMPEGLVDTLGGAREFLDLVCYLRAISGDSRPAGFEAAVATALEDSADDLANLDHAGIIGRLNKRDLEAGRGIYEGYCANCHGLDGDRPSLPTARALGKEPLKFGSDPYSLFLTLSRGNGLMGPANHLTPKQRYQVVHYIREAFIVPGGLDAKPIDKAYLASLLEGDDLGDQVPQVDRDFGPALASQLGTDVHSALTIRIGPLSIAYNLHTLDVARVWQDGFLDLQNTQHALGRGEGKPLPKGVMLDGLAGTRWGHDGTLDYAADDVRPRGQLPDRWLDYHGYHLHGDRLILSYAIDGREVLESPKAIVATKGSMLPAALSRTFKIGPGGRLLLALPGGASDAISDAVADVAEIPVVRLSENAQTQEVSRVVMLGVVGDREGLKWRRDDRGRISLEIPADAHSRELQIITEMAADDRVLKRFERRVMGRSAEATQDPSTMLGGGATRWGEVMSSIGYLGFERGAYALDTITLPDWTPWNTWFRTSAIDFFPDGRLVVVTYGGDVWIATGVDEELLDIRWKRYAAGLYEPMGVKVVDDRIHVTCKDRLVRLHDRNGNGEADFYESFHADPDVATHFHAFNFDLQVDSKGNFYYAKGGLHADFELPGAVIQVSPDGKRHEVLATGFRTPNGMGILPDDRITVSDNQGHWMPSSKINVIRPGGFYGWVDPKLSRASRGSADSPLHRSTSSVPDDFDRPVVWIPHEIDNSSGGQLWADDPRWGPLAGRLIHTSFGKGWMYYVLSQDLDDATQAAIIRLPFDFRTGIMRARVNPADGQVYATGLDGWNGGGRFGLLDQGIQRLRYTGRAHPMVTEARAERSRLRLSFNFRLDRGQASLPSAYQISQWNYRWTSAYGSDQYSPKTGKVGVDEVAVKVAEVSDDAMTVWLELDDLREIDQLKLVVDLKDESGESFSEEIFWTIHSLPEATDP